MVKLTNDEKLWNEIESCLVYNDDGTYYGDSVFLHTTSIENLIDWFKNKEKELLKEFVEWLKVKYQKERKAWFEIAQEKEQAKDKWEKSKANGYFGRSYGFDRAATDLDQDLEKFLEIKTVK